MEGTIQEYSYLKKNDTYYNFNYSQDIDLEDEEICTRCNYF